MATLAADLATPARRNPLGVPLVVRGLALVGGTVVTLASTIAVMRVATGLAPDPAGAKEIAVLIHLSAVLPAVPLGVYVLLSKKGDARHRMLGKLWMLLMLVTAVSALFIRHLNHNHYSWIHLFVPLTIVGMVRAISTARAGNIAAHKRTLILLYLSGVLGPGLFAFLPGRIMWLWLVG